MSVAGTYRIRKTLPKPNPDGPAGETFTVENIFVLEDAGDYKLRGTVDTGDGVKIPLEEGYGFGEFFKIIYPVGPGKWEINARVRDGKVAGVVSAFGGGFPNLAEGERI